MGAEIGATTSLFAFNERQLEYMHATGRGEMAALAEENASMLEADEGAEYDQRINIDLSSLEPALNGPFTPDLYTPVKDMKETAK